MDEAENRGSRRNSLLIASQKAYYGTTLDEYSDSLAKPSSVNVIDSTPFSIWYTSPPPLLRDISLRSLQTRRKSLGITDEGRSYKERIRSNSIGKPNAFKTITGERARKQIESLQKDSLNIIRGFLRTNAPRDFETHLCIRSRTSSLVTIIRIDWLRNFMNVIPEKKCVKWKKRSLDKISVYRYSLPSVTLSVNSRVSSFVRKNQTCVLLVIWSLILIVLAMMIVFGSFLSSLVKYTSKIVRNSSETVNHT